MNLMKFKGADDAVKLTIRYEASSLSASDMRQYEYMNHVKTFVTHWYAFDESSYEEHFACAQPHRQQGERAVERINDVNMLNSLIQKEYPLRVRIKDVEIKRYLLPER